ncbi:hypothetical protein A5662_17570 [Mycobacteriaceae bacterium 1482268.1]|nr:hypothetical protein A5662_17570 [Mycobacteriaceae bacterium 1482268.1]
MQIWRIIATLLIALATASTATAVVHAGRDDGGPLVHRPSVLIVGDSFTAGVASHTAYPELVARTADWDLHVDAQGATGFIADGQGTGNGDTSRLIDRLAEDGQRFPKVDLLIIDAGRNDLDHPTDDIVSAVAEYVAAARTQWPGAEIAEIFPTFVNATPFDAYSDLRARIATCLSAAHSTLIDPIAEGWYSDVDVETLVSEDRVHPNMAGNALIADRLSASLRRRAIIPAI